MRQSPCQKPKVCPYLDNLKGTQSSIAYVQLFYDVGNKKRRIVIRRKQNARKKQVCC